MELTQAEQKIWDAALVFARGHKKDIATRLTDISRFTSEKNPVSVFMAGSPGAGKTEASVELLTSVEADGF